MTSSELLAVLMQEWPNGVSFDPMAVRLLRQKIPLEDWQIEDLKAEMFQLGNGLWFSREMICDLEVRLDFGRQVAKWLMENGFFSVELLFEGYCGSLCHIATSDNCAIFLRHLGFTVASFGKGLFCLQPPTSLNERLAATANTISELIDEADGTLALSEIEEAMPHLTAEALDAIRAQFLPEAHVAEIGGVPCWRTTEAIPLPDDFAERLTTAVDTLVELEEKVTAAKLVFALNLFYRIRFREEYALTDNGTFMRICAKYYQGGNDVFPKAKTSSLRINALSASSKRVRSPNTRFRNLCVPIGAELVFTKDSHITCTVLDDINQVEYESKSWAISTLAERLLGVSNAQGFRFFRYEGETLWERRLRLERGSNQGKCQVADISQPAKEQVAGIIGLNGQPLSPATWRAFRSAGISSCVAEWAKRVENGERMENIAWESECSVSTIKLQIGNRRRYFKTCEINKIMPEGGVNV